MAEMKVEVHVLDMPEVKAILERYKKINKRRDWVGRRSVRALRRACPA